MPFCILQILDETRKLFGVCLPQTQISGLNCYYFTNRLSTSIKIPKEDATLADRRYTPEVFEQICGAATDKGEVQSSVHVSLDDNGKPTAAKVPAWMWLEYIAANLVQEG